MSELQKKHKQLKRLRIRNITLNTVCILLALAGISWTINYFWKYVHYEITNDAVVDQYIAPLNIRASGYIKEVRFTEHQPVHAGDTLLILDNREYLIKVKDAEAALMDAKGAKDVLSSGIQTSQVNVAIQEANIAETKAKLWQQEQDYRRYANLLAEESVSQQQYEQVKTAYEATQARYQALLQQKEAAKSQYSETSKKSTGIEANILRKEADLDMAKLNLSYTIVTAPYDGYMGPLNRDNSYKPDKPSPILYGATTNGSLPTTKKRRFPTSTSDRKYASRSMLSASISFTAQLPPYPKQPVPSTPWFRLITPPATSSKCSNAFPFASSWTTPAPKR